MNNPAKQRLYVSVSAILLITFHAPVGIAGDGYYRAGVTHPVYTPYRSTYRMPPPGGWEAELERVDRQSSAEDSEQPDNDAARSGEATPQATGAYPGYQPGLRDDHHPYTRRYETPGRPRHAGAPYYAGQPFPGPAPQPWGYGMPPPVWHVDEPQPEPATYSEIPEPPQPGHQERAETQATSQPLVDERSARDHRDFAVPTALTDQAMPEPPVATYRSDYGKSGKATHSTSKPRKSKRKSNYRKSRNRNSFSPFGSSVPSFMEPWRYSGTGKNGFSPFTGDFPNFGSGRNGFSMFGMNPSKSGSRPRGKSGNRGRNYRGR